MNEKNYEYLKDQLKYSGFGEGMNEDLKKKMEEQNSDFKLYHHADIGNDKVVASLHFRKSNQSDMFFFNKFELNLKKSQSQQIDKQTFYQNNKGENITLKEAYNLMSGRAVHKTLANKEGEIYKAWQQIDFKNTDKDGNFKLKQYHQNYGYDLEKTLGKNPIKELKHEEDRKMLIQSLERGNRQAVTFQQNGNEQIHFIEANPQFKTINIYDSHQQRLNTKQLQEKKQPKEQSQTNQQEVKKSTRKKVGEDDGPGVPKATKKRAKRKSRSIG